MDAEHVEALEVLRDVGHGQASGIADLYDNWKYFSL
jgi:hypothetical protein